jgi:hypothetical protein
MRALGPTAFGCGSEVPELAGADGPASTPSRGSDGRPAGGASEQCGPPGRDPGRRPEPSELSEGGEQGLGRISGAGSAHRLASRPARSRTREADNGGGFSDLELAVAAEAGLIDPSTVVVTTVHELQVRRAGEIPTTAHDIHVDVIVTPERVIECARPSGYRAPRLRWPELTEDKIAAIPLLQRLR